MSAIAVKFDLAFQALPYPTLRELLRGTGTIAGKGIALLPRTLMRLIKASNLSRTFRII